MGRIFVTVGTTSFDALIEAIDSPLFIREAKELGYDSVVAQIGRGKYVPRHLPLLDNEEKSGKCSSYRFKPTLDDDFAEADLVISHAGAGSIMESLRMRRRILVVVNETLMHNHQWELANALRDGGYLDCTTPKVSKLCEALRRVDATTFASYPDVEAAAFASLVNDEARCTKDRSWLHITSAAAVAAASIIYMLTTT